MADPISCEGWDTGKPFLGVPSKFVVINGDGEEVGTLDELIPLLMLVSNNLSDIENAVEARNNLGVYSKTEVDTAIEDAVDNATPDASTTTKGVAKIATTVITQAGTNDTDFITPKKLFDFIKSNVIKNNFTDVKSSRASGVTYTNPSTSQFLNVRVNLVVPNGGFAEAYVNNILEYKTTTSGGGSWGEYLFLLVPPMGTYKVIGSAISYWGEA